MLLQINKTSVLSIFSLLFQNIWKLINDSNYCKYIANLFHSRRGKWQSNTDIGKVQVIKSGVVIIFGIL